MKRLKTILNIKDTKKNFTETQQFIIADLPENTQKEIKTLLIKKYQFSDIFFTHQYYYLMGDGAYITKTHTLENIKKERFKKYAFIYTIIYYKKKFMIRIAIEK